MFIASPACTFNTDKMLLSNHFYPYSYIVFFLNPWPTCSAVLNLVTTRVVISSPTLAPTKLQDTITLWLYEIVENQIYRRKLDISRRFQIWSQIWQGVTLKNIDFFVFNLTIKRVKTKQYILGSACHPLMTCLPSQIIYISSMIPPPDHTRWIAWVNMFY
jgi:hypothetical protein